VIGPALLGVIAGYRRSVLDHAEPVAYSGDGSYPRTISAGSTDISGGGLIWVKARNAVTNNQIAYLNGGTVRLCIPNLTTAPSVVTNLTFGNGEFTVENATGVTANDAAQTYMVWVIKRVAGVLDIVTYTGDGTASKAVAHSLGEAPGVIAVIPRAAGGRPVGSEALDPTVPWTYRADLLTSNQIELAAHWASTAPTASEFYVGQDGANGANANAVVYDALLFASDTSSTGRVACGLYTGNGGTAGPTVTCGWQPRIVIIKATNGSGTNWLLFDQARSPGFSGNDPVLSANTTAAEPSASNHFELTSNGFTLQGVTTSDSTGSTYLWIAIR
jgi:hypothetical protein